MELILMIIAAGLAVKLVYIWVKPYLFRPREVTKEMQDLAAVEINRHRGATRLGLPAVLVTSGDEEDERLYQEQFRLATFNGEDLILDPKFGFLPGNTYHQFPPYSNPGDLDR